MQGSPIEIDLRGLEAFERALVQYFADPIVEAVSNEVGQDAPVVEALAYVVTEAYSEILTTVIHRVVDRAAVPPADTIGLPENEALGAHIRREAQRGAS